MLSQRIQVFACMLAMFSIALASGNIARAAAPATASAPVQAGDKPAFSPEELEQLLAPIALYPDSLLTQILMASTYPLEVVSADRWVKANKELKDEALTKALEAQSWDPSVKSLVNFPPVLAMMSEQLEHTVKVGDAFISQQKDVMATIQKLRGKARETGNLTTTAQQKVVVEKEVIVIEAANPQVVYIPTYPPTVYYATWPYPSYPPAPYYPPGHVAGSALAFGAGVAVGAAWGYAWGHSDWHGGDVDIDVNRNTNINTNINRSNYQNKMAGVSNNGRGTFQHDPVHRQGVSYRDNKTASQFGRTSPADAARARDSFRGRDSGGIGTAGGVGSPGGVGNRSGVGSPGGVGDRGGVGSPGGAGSRGGVGDSGGFGGSSARPSPSAGQNTFSGVDRGGSGARTDSARGSASRASTSASPSRSAPSRSAGSGGGGGRGR